MERAENGVHPGEQPEAEESTPVKNSSHLVNGESDALPEETVACADGNVSKDSNGNTPLPTEHRSGANGQYPSVYNSQAAVSEAASKQGYRPNSDGDRIMYGNMHNSAPDGSGNGRRRMTSKTNVYVSGLKPTDTQEILYSLVHPKLTPKSVTVVADKDGRSQGYGFLDFKSEDESRAAIEIIKECNPKFVVRLANESEKDKTNLYLRGLPKNDTYDEEDLSAAFRSFGEVVSVKIMTERNPSPGNQHPRTGIGFVRFQNEEDARRALERINENREQIKIKGMEVTVEAKFADKQVGRSHPSHNAHPSQGANPGGNHHTMSAAARPMPATVPVHGNNIQWNLLQNGAPLYPQHHGLAAGLFRNNYQAVAQTPSGPILWTHNNGQAYLSHDSWNEANLSAGLASVNISPMNHMPNESLSESSHLPSNGQATIAQQTQTSSEPNTTISHANAMQGTTNSGIVLSRHPSIQNHGAVDWNMMNLHQADPTNGRPRHSNTTQTQPQPTQPQGQHIAIQPQQLGANANSFTPYFNMNQTTNAMGYNANQPNGYLPMVPGPPVSIHSTEGGYQLTPGGCVFYGNPPIYSSTQMAPNTSGHVNPFHGPSAGGVTSGQPVGGSIPNGSVGIYPYQQGNSALQWAAIAANHGASMPPALAAPQYYQTPQTNGYQAMCTYPQPPAQGAGRLPHGNSVPTAQATAPQAPAPSSVSVTGNGSVTTAATAP